jgi:8-oxo-dGTP diphosphatase
MVSGWIAVSAGALRREDGCWLMHRRPAGKHHAGLWEFPGGKAEAYEMPVETLQRELAEELGIQCRPEGCLPAAFAETAASAGAPKVVILLYIVSAWEGEPEALEGGTIGWFTAAEALALPKPPLDVALAAQLFAG